MKVTIEEEKLRYFNINSLRNPFRDVELYILPIAVAVVSLILSVIVDKSCSSDFCEQAEDAFVNVYLFVFFGILVLTWKQISGGYKYLKDILVPIISNEIAKQKIN